MSTPNPPPQHLSAFISFPSPYTQSLLLSALTSTLPSLSITTTSSTNTNNPTTEDADVDVPQLQWADYDILTLSPIPRNPTTHLISSYIYRKTLIRKHLLHTAIQEYVAKQIYRGKNSVLEGGRGGVPRGWVVDVQFADELDELLVDELYDLREMLEANAEVGHGRGRRWFILKPGMSDKGQGIRMFSTVQELIAIFESFEPESDSEDEGDDEDEDEADEEGTEQDTSDRIAMEKLAISAAAEAGFADDEPYEEPDAGDSSSHPRGNQDGDDDDDEDEEAGTGVRMSQLRHFVIQEYLPRPVLLDPMEGTTAAGESLAGHKFHLRAYTLLTGTYKLYLARTMLALFSDKAFTLPKGEVNDESGEEELDLRGHLTNTCLQTDAAGNLTPPDHLVKLFWDLNKTPTALSTSADLPDNEYRIEGKITQEWLEEVFEGAGEVIVECVRAAVECGGFGLQLLPNAFEIFGVDLLLSFPETIDTPNGTLPRPIITLLEFNASPDFFQSGDRLRTELGDMFKGVVELVVAPFFGLKMIGEDDDEEGEKQSWAGEWKLIGEAETRGSW